MSDFAASEQSPPRLLQIRVGRCLPPAEYQEKLGPEGWPCDIPSAYFKHEVSEVEVTFAGLEGNESGHPSHIENAQYRAAMIHNTLHNEYFKDLFPDHVFQPGDFGENFIVDHPSLTVNEVCVGDQYQIGSAIFRVSGPRFPCPKVDAAQKLKGVQKLGLENGWAGYFYEVIQEGVCKVGDEIRLLQRPHPGFTIHRVASGIWGPKEKQDNSREFLEALSNMEALMPRHFRITAQTRLARLNAES
eukprot:gene8650-9361_t